MVCELRVELQYELKARNLMLNNLDNPDLLKQNDQGELVINNVAELNTDFYSLFSSMVGLVHELKQFGIDKFLGSLRQIGIKRNKLSDQSKDRRVLANAAPACFLNRCSVPARKAAAFVLRLAARFGQKRATSAETYPCTVVCRSAIG